MTLTLRGGGFSDIAEICLSRLSQQLFIGSDPVKQNHM